MELRFISYLFIYEFYSRVLYYAFILAGPFTRQYIYYSPLHPGYCITSIFFLLCSIMGGVSGFDPSFVYFNVCFAANTISYCFSLWLYTYSLCTRTRCFECIYLSYNLKNTTSIIKYQRHYSQGMNSYAYHYANMMF